MYLSEGVKFTEFWYSTINARGEIPPIIQMLFKKVIILLFRFLYQTLKHFDLQNN